MLKRKKVMIAAISTLSVIGLCLSTGTSCYYEEETTFTVNDTLPDGNGKEAIVILLGGQSNASGCSWDEYLQKNITAEKHAEYKAGYDNVYINYLSGPRMSEGFIKCATLQGEPEGTFGPELGLAEKLHEAYPEKTFFIIKCAWGGTNLYSEWLSPSAKGRTGKLYKQFVTYVKTSMEYLISKNYDAKIEGMCWMQGESDSISVKVAKRYGENLSYFIEDVRNEFSKYAAEDGIAFIDAYIADTPGIWPYYETVNCGKDEVAAKSPMNTVIDTIAAGLECTEEPEGAPDLAHYDSMSEIKLGHLFAEALSEFLN